MFVSCSFVVVFQSQLSFYSELFRCCIEYHPEYFKKNFLMFYLYSVIFLNQDAILFEDKYE